MTSTRLISDLLAQRRSSKVKVSLGVSNLSRETEFAPVARGRLLLQRNSSVVQSICDETYQPHGRREVHGK